MRAGCGGGRAVAGRGIGPGSSAGPPPLKQFAVWADWPLVGEPVTHVRGDHRLGDGQGRPNDAGSGGGPQPECGRWPPPITCWPTSPSARRCGPMPSCWSGRTATTKPVRTVAGAHPSPTRRAHRSRRPLGARRVPPHRPCAGLRGGTQHDHFRCRRCRGEAATAVGSTPGRELDRAARNAIGGAIDGRPAVVGPRPHVHSLMRCPPMRCWSLPIRCRSEISTPSCSTPDRSPAAANRGAAGIDGTCLHRPGHCCGRSFQNGGPLHRRPGPAARSERPRRGGPPRSAPDSGVRGQRRRRDLLAAARGRHAYRPMTSNGCSAPHTASTCAASTGSPAFVLPACPRPPGWATQSAPQRRRGLRASTCWSSTSAATTTWPSAEP